MNEWARERIGPGRLVLVVGPSGAGKDTLIALTRAALRDDGNVVFARRVVTRPASAAENNIEVSTQVFSHARDAGGFAIWWQAHGLHYALPSAIDDDIRAGRTVVANGSRGVVAALRARYADCVVVEITAPEDVLALRLAERGRPSDGPIGERLTRVAPAVVPDITIDNVGRAEIHARDLAEVIRAGVIKTGVAARR